MISSGDLELYVLGLCDERMNARIAELAGKHPEVAEEIKATEDALLMYAEGRGVPDIPSSFKQQLLSRIEELPQTTEGQKNSESRRSTFKTFRNIPVAWMAAAACFALLMLSSINNYRYRGIIHDQQLQISKLESENGQYKENYTHLTHEVEQYKNHLNILKGNIERVPMAGLAISPGSSALVYWDKESSQTLLAVNSLPAPPPDKQYQLWAIVDGKPIDAGIFDVDSSGALLNMKVIAGPVQAFAVTLEKKGGSPLPTLDQMYVLGTVDSKS